MKHQEYAAHDAVGLAELVRAGEVTPRELVDAALARMDAVNGRLNAVVHRMDDTAREAAEGELPEGPFRGVPFVVKDMDGYLAGEPYTSASRALRGYVPNHDSELFARYRQAGVVFVGKTNCPEFGILGITEPELHGPTRNPWNTEYTPGGSSGGSGAAVAGGIVPVAHAGDGGGSIRIPASANGLFGMKPSRGRIPLGPDEGEAWNGLVVRHVVSRTVRDSAAFLDVTQGGDTGAPYAAPPEGDFLAAAARNPTPLRIGYSTQSQLGRDTDPECRDAVEDTVELLEELGHELVEVDLPIDRSGLAHAYLTIVAANVGRLVDDTELMTGRSPEPDSFEAATWFLRQVSDVVSARDLVHALELVARTTRRLGSLFADQIDVHVSPTMPYPPARVGELGPTAIQRATLRALRTLPVNVGPALRTALSQLAANSLERAANTQVWNMTGQPAMSVPLHWTPQGLPVGVQFAGAFGAEETLYSLAGQLERVQPWMPRLIGPVTARIR